MYYFTFTINYLLSPLTFATITNRTWVLVVYWVRIPNEFENNLLVELKITWQSFKIVKVWDTLIKSFSKVGKRKWYVNPHVNSKKNIFFSLCSLTFNWSVAILATTTLFYICMLRSTIQQSVIDGMQQLEDR